MIHTNLKAGDASHLGPLLLLLLFVKNKQRKIKQKKNARISDQQVKAETVRLQSAHCTMYVCENCHVKVRDLPDCLALHGCCIKKQAPKGDL